MLSLSPPLLFGRQHGTLAASPCCLLLSPAKPVRCQPTSTRATLLSCCYLAASCVAESPACLACPPLLQEVNKEPPSLFWRCFSALCYLVGSNGRHAGCSGHDTRQLAAQLSNATAGSTGTVPCFSACCRCVFRSHAVAHIYCSLGAGAVDRLHLAGTPHVRQVPQPAAHLLCPR